MRFTASKHIGIRINLSFNLNRTIYKHKSTYNLALELTDYVIHIFMTLTFYFRSIRNLCSLICLTNAILRVV